MAFTERYVTQAAGGGGSGTEGSPWTFAEAVTNAVAGDRINVKSDSAYSIGATTFGAGTFDAPIIWRGYDTTIGDCDDLGRNADGTLNTTGMPEITVTATWTMANHIVLQSLKITATAVSSQILGNTAADQITYISLRVENSTSNASAKCINHDDEITLINCDLICSGATSDTCMTSDVRARLHGCRLEMASTDNCLEINSGCTVSNCVFLKTGTLGGNGILIDSAIVNATVISNCTFFNFTNAIASTAAHTAGSFVLIENHCTDCTQFISNTTNIACFDIRNRTRDITTPPGTVELITVGAITTDTGGASTDYADSANGDLHLITTAAGYNAGWNGGDIGGLQTDPPAGGGSGGGGLILGGLGQTGIGQF